MKLYLVSQEIVNGYDSYDSVVVSAESEQDARNIHPSPYVTHVTDGKWMGTYKAGKNEGKEYEQDSDGWPPYSMVNQIKVEYLGETDKPKGVILASYNAG